MDKDIKEVIQIIKDNYLEMEKILIEESKKEKEICKLGAPFGVDITWQQNQEKNELGIHFYGGGLSLLRYIPMTKDVMFMTQDINENDISSELEAFIAKRCEMYEFGTLYAPNFQVKVRFWLGKPINYINREFTIESIEKNKEAIKIYRELWLTEEYKTWDFYLNNFWSAKAYAYLINDLSEELGNEEVIKRLDYMLERHRVAIEVAGKGNCGREKSHRRDLLEAFSDFAYKYGYLNPYVHFDNQDKVYNVEEATPEVQELLLYMGLALVRYEGQFRNEGKPLIKELSKRKYLPAKQCLEIGTGDISYEDAVWKSDLATCTCNDIFKTINLKLVEENEETYNYMLDYMLHLMDKGFTKEYRITFNSKVKNLVPVKSLRKSPTHKFWANCVMYENLRPKVVDYVREMMKDDWFYGDGPEDDETPMATGGYAMLALAFSSLEYANLFCEYLTTNNHYDHNIFSDKTIEAYLMQWGVTKINVETVLECLYWHSDLKCKKVDFSDFKTIDVLKEVNSLTRLRKESLKLIVNFVWKSKDNLEKEIVTSTGEEKEELQKLLDKLND